MRPTFIPVSTSDSLLVSRANLLRTARKFAELSGDRLRPLAVLWRFSRPHTMVGTTLSIGSVYAIAAKLSPAVAPRAVALDLFWTLIAAWAVNIFIVGLNQIEDVDLDRINKPFLPLPAGELTRRVAWCIVGSSTLVAILLALANGPVEVAAVGSALVIGAAYSLPPIRLKRDAALASLSIVIVRSVIVNLGVWMHVCRTLHGPAAIHPAIWALVAVTVPFSFAIAILKDVPDIEGDKRFGISTFSVRLGGQIVVVAAAAVVLLAQIGMAIGGTLFPTQANRFVLVGGHVLAALLLVFAVRRVDVHSRSAVTTFYQRVWQFFFFEYVIVTASFLS